MPNPDELDTPTIVDKTIFQKTYSLPKGSTDVERLELQHQVFTLRLGGLYPEEVEPQVQQLMAQGDAAILDVGCGSGPVWCVQMAQHFPKVKIIGLDMAPVVEGEYPPNFSFIRHDLTNGLPDEYKGRFSIIHCRMVCQHLPDSQTFVNCMAECLRPGGLLLEFDADFQTYDQDKKPITPFQYNPALGIEENLSNPEGLSWHAAWFLQLGRVIQNPKYQTPTELIRHSGLKRVMAKEYFIPFGWEGEGIRDWKKLGELQMRDYQMIYKISPGIFARIDDIPGEIKEALITKGYAELSTHKFYGCFPYTIGMKPQ